MTRREGPREREREWNAVNGPRKTMKNQRVLEMAGEGWKILAPKIFSYRGRGEGGG